jgi:hypothetical protein
MDRQEESGIIYSYLRALSNFIKLQAWGVLVLKLMIGLILISGAAFAQDSCNENPSNSLICQMYTRDLGHEVSFSTKFTENGATLEQLVGAKYLFKVFAKRHRCVQTIELRDMQSGYSYNGGSTGGCSVSSYAGSKAADGTFDYYYFCKTTE